MSEQGAKQQNGAPTNGAALATQAAAATIEIAKGGEIVKVGYDTFQGFQALQRVGSMFAASDIVPKQYQGKLANCCIAVNMAIRLGADPLMVMTHGYIVHGKLGWSAQYMISSFNTCGRFTAIKYRWIGERGADTWGCIAWAREKDTNDVVEGPEVTVALAKAEGWWAQNAKWRNMTQLMLMYRSASFLVKTTAPELTMGMQTVEELEDVGGPDDAFTAPPSVTAGEAPAAPTTFAGSAPQETADVLKSAQEAARAAAAEATHG